VSVEVGFGRNAISTEKGTPPRPRTDKSMKISQPTAGISSSDWNGFDKSVDVTHPASQMISRLEHGTTSSPYGEAAYRSPHASTSVPIDSASILSGGNAAVDAPDFLRLLSKFLKLHNPDKAHLAISFLEKYKVCLLFLSVSYLLRNITHKY
jgi:hypothetical protein